MVQGSGHRWRRPRVQAATLTARPRHLPHHCLLLVLVLVLVLVASLTLQQLLMAVLVLVPVWVLVLP